MSLSILLIGPILYQFSYCLQCCYAGHENDANNGNLLPISISHFEQHRSSWSEKVGGGELLMSVARDSTELNFRFYSIPDFQLPY